MVIWEALKHESATFAHLYILIFTPIFWFEFIKHLRTCGSNRVFEIRCHYSCHTSQKNAFVKVDAVWSKILPTIFHTTGDLQPRQYEVRRILSTSPIISWGMYQTKWFVVLGVGAIRENNSFNSYRELFPQTVFLGLTVFKTAICCYGVTINYTNCFHIYFKVFPGSHLCAECFHSSFQLMCGSFLSSRMPAPFFGPL